MEYLDVYTTDHRKTGRIVVRGQADLTVQERVLAVHAGLFNERGEMLIQQRQTTKKKYPGWWDVSAGGLAQHGEESLQGILREIGEELGLTFPADALTFVQTAEFDNMLDDFYIARCSSEPAEMTLQAEEVLAVRWAAEEEILRLQRERQFVDYDPLIIRALFAAARQYVTEV